MKNLQKWQAYELQKGTISIAAKDSVKSEFGIEYTTDLIVTVHGRSDKHQANAKLLASAPEMAEMLMELLNLEHAKPRANMGRIIRIMNLLEKAGVFDE